MHNRINQVLEQYPFTINQIRKGRGAVICETDQGLKIIKEYRGSERKADFLYQVLVHLGERLLVDTVVKTKEGTSIAKDGMDSYVVRNWYEGRECDTKNKDDIMACLRILADLHNELNRYEGEIPDFLKERANRTRLEYEKHNRELKKVKRYIAAKKKKNEFELKYLSCYPIFSSQANKLLAQFEQDLEMETGKGFGICHGDFNQHNVVFSKAGMAVVNFEHMMYGLQVEDLGLFLRKIMEKHNWNPSLFADMMACYETGRPLTEMEKKQLYIRLAYPEKFWKISNHYYNSGKAWVCGRNLEKLEQIMEQNEKKEEFLALFHQ